MLEISPQPDNSKIKMSFVSIRDNTWCVALILSSVWKWCFHSFIPLNIKTLWNKNISCHINQQEMSQPPAISSKCEGGPPKLQSSRSCHPPEWLLRSWGNARSKVNKGTGLAPDSWGAYERNELSEPRGLHLPIYRMLNSFTWYLIFDDQTAFSLCCKLVYSLTSPLLPWSSFLRATEMLSLGLGDSETPKHYHQIK